MKTIDVPSETIPPNQAVAKIERHESAIGKALTVGEMTDRLRLIKAVMQENMTVDVDYGKVPGCGDKPGLFQPGAQKLSMMFQLSPEVRQETITDYQNFHRGYRIIIRVSNGPKFAEGVGECSTLESKYRYRNAGRICPKCHKETVIEGKPEYGGGFVCYKKKGGCGEKFATNSELGKQIAQQAGGKVEHENPPDHWNTVQKMAFKRAFVHAIINATNTSELWSQDLEDLAANGVVTKPKSDDDDGDLGPVKNNSGASGPHKATAHPSAANPKGPGATGTATKREESPTGAAKPASQPCYATTQSRMKFLHTMGAAPGEPGEQMMKHFCIAAGMILDSESVIDLPLRFVPVWAKQVDLWKAAIADFESGGDATIPFYNEEDPNLGGEKGGKNSPMTSDAAPSNHGATGKSSASLASAPAQSVKRHPEWFFDAVCPIPRKGMKRDAYMTNPDTIGSMFDARHGQDETSTYLRGRLFGFLNNFEPNGWEKRDGTKMPPSQADIEFREALDALGEYLQAKGEKI